MKKDLSLVLGIVVIALVMLGSCTQPAQEAEVYTFTNEIAGDASPAVLARVLAAAEKPFSEMKFEKGTYHFYPDKAYEQFVHISNHNDEMISTPMPLFNFKNLTIDGQGSTFVFHGRMIPFLIDGSENITVKNLSIDWHEPFHSEALVVANDEKNKTFDIHISEEYPYEIRKGQLYFLKEYYEHDLGQAILFDPARKAIMFETELYTPLTTYSGNVTQYSVNNINYKYGSDKLDPIERIRGRTERLESEQIKPGLVRIHNHGKKLPPVGMIMVCKGEQHKNRLSPAFRVTHTKGFYATNVNVHHAGGMGLIAENSENLILDGFNITPSHGRMVSTTADATHFVGCRGRVELKNCTFMNQLDDATNVHGTYQQVVDVLNEYTIGARMGHFQQQGFVIGYPGDKIGLVRLSDSFAPYHTLTIKSIQYINGRYQKITFNEKLPEGLAEGDLIENLDAYPELLVQNCTISNNRARGLLLSTPKKTVIDNNFFHTEMEALLIPVESSHWYESGSAANLTITNNTFQDCQHAGFNRGVIRFETDDDNENIAFNTIVIENNTFNHFDNWILEVSNVDGLKFTNNKITCTGTFEQRYPQNPVVTVEASKNIEITDNKYEGKATDMVEVDDISRVMGSLK